MLASADRCTKCFEFSHTHAADGFKFAFEQVAIQQIAHANGGGAPHLIRIRRTDPATGCADGTAVARSACALGEEIFKRSILILVIRHDDMRAIGDAKVAADFNAALSETFNFIEDLFGVHNDAVADDVHLALT